MRVYAAYWGVKLGCVHGLRRFDHFIILPENFVEPSHLFRRYLRPGFPHGPAAFEIIQNRSLRTLYNR
jgi:hypothetical protein